MQASVELSDEIVAAIGADPNSYNQLGSSPAIQSYQQLYWEDMSNGTGEDYTTVFNSLGVSCTIKINSAPTQQSLQKMDLDLSFAQEQAMRRQRPLGSDG